MRVHRHPASLVNKQDKLHIDMALRHGWLDDGKITSEEIVQTMQLAPEDRPTQRVDRHVRNTFYMAAMWGRTLGQDLFTQHEDGSKRVNFELLQIGAQTLPKPLRRGGNIHNQVVDGSLNTGGNNGGVDLLA